MNYKYYFIISFVALISCFSLLSCDTGGLSQEEHSIQKFKHVKESTNAKRGVDSLFMEISNRLPGFAGLYKDQSGRLNINIHETSTSRKNYSINKIRSAIEQVLSDRKISLRKERSNINKVEYTFEQLFHHKIFLTRKLLGDDVGAVAVDADEKNNVVSIYVQDEYNKQNILEKIDNTGINEDILNIQEIPERNELEPIDPPNISPSDTNQTLQGRVRPMGGGIEIAPLSTCTMTAVTDWYTQDDGVLVKRHGFITNSHCTNSNSAIGTNNGIYAAQPSRGPVVGKEIHDPNKFTNSQVEACPSGRDCRFSDSALFTFYEETDPYGNYGHIIYRPIDSSNSQAGSVKIDNSKEPWDVDETGYSLVGEKINKVGRTTGWTYGTVSKTNVNIKYTPGGNDTGTTILSQNISEDLIAQPGDSGSPVFKITPSGTEVVGVVWYREGQLFGYNIVYSPWSNVKRDLPKGYDPSEE